MSHSEKQLNMYYIFVTFIKSKLNWGSRATFNDEKLLVSFKDINLEVEICGNNNYPAFFLRVGENFVWIHADMDQDKEHIMKQNLPALAQHKGVDPEAWLEATEIMLRFYAEHYNGTGFPPLSNLYIGNPLFDKLVEYLAVRRMVGKWRVSGNAIYPPAESKINIIQGRDDHLLVIINNTHNRIDQQRVNAGLLAIVRNTQYDKTMHYQYLDILIDAIGEDL